MAFVLRVASALVVLASAAADAQPPGRLSGPGVDPAVWGVLATPRAPGTHPGVILLPGSSGWKPTYAGIAKRLSESGFVALALDYHAATGPASEEPRDRAAKWSQWQQTVRNAAAHLHSLPAVSDRPIGLVGYSLGAFLAVSVASSTPSVRAVVDFFGGGAADEDGLEREVRGFPALLILHGDADVVVPISAAHRLREAVLAQGGRVEMHVYPAVGHAFNAPWSPSYSEAITEDSYCRMVDFLAGALQQ